MAEWMGRRCLARRAMSSECIERSLNSSAAAESLPSALLSTGGTPISGPWSPVDSTGVLTPDLFGSAFCRVEELC